MRDPSLNVHYKSVTESLMPILRSLGTKSTVFLPQIMPPLLAIMRSSDPNFRELLFSQLSSLVSTTKHGIRDYLDEIFELITEHWSARIQ